MSNRKLANSIELFNKYFLLILTKAAPIAAL
jgi:hypothetical protein